MRPGSPKPATSAIALERGVAGLDRRPGDLQAQALHGLCGRRPGLRREGAGEVPRAHGGAVGEALDGQRLGEMRAHPLDQLDEAAGPPAQFHERRELRLAAGPALVDDELLRRPAGDVGAEIVLDEGQRQIDAGGDAGRGPDIAVADEDAIGVQLDLRIAAAEVVRAAPSAWWRGGRRAARPQPGDRRPSRRWRSAARVVRLSQATIFAAAASERTISPPDTMIVSKGPSAAARPKA